MKCRLFNKTVGTFFLFSFLLSSNVFSMRFFPSKGTDLSDKFQGRLCYTIESSAQSGGLFRDQDGFRRQDYRNTIREGIISFFHNAGARFFSEIRKRSYAYSETLFDGLLTSITSGRSKTQNSLRTFFRKKEHRKAIQESVARECEKITRTTWKFRILGLGSLLKKIVIGGSVSFFSFYLAMGAYSRLIQNDHLGTHYAIRGLLGLGGTYMGCKFFDFMRRLF